MQLMNDGAGIGVEVRGSCVVLGSRVIVQEVESAPIMLVRIRLVAQVLTFKPFPVGMRRLEIR